MVSVQMILPVCSPLYQNNLVLLHLGIIIPNYKNRVLIRVHS